MTFNDFDKIKIPCLCFIVTHDSIKLEYVNNSAREMLGYDKLPNLDISGVLSIPVDSTKTCCSTLEFLQTSCDSWVFTDAVKTDGSKIPVGVNAVEFLEADTKHVAVILRDRTESIKTNLELNQALADASLQKEEALKSKEEAIKA